MPPQVPQEGGEAPPGRRGEQEPGIDKRLLWGSVGAGVLLVGIIVAIQLSKKSPEEPAKKKDSGKEVAAADRMPNPDTPEGRAEIERGFVNWPPAKISKFIGVLSPDSATKLKDILIPHMLRMDEHAGFTDAWNIAERLWRLKDERVLGKILELALKKASAASLLKPYGAMGAEAVIAKAKGDAANLPAYALMLKECSLEEANAPLVAAAETCDVPAVAWVCGDTLYDRDVPIQLARVQAWLADPNPLAQASGVRQMSLQKGTDRDAAIAPFTAAETPLEIKKAVMRVVAKHKDLSKDHMKRMLNLEDQETFEECMAVLTEQRLVDYIPELEEIAAGPRNFKFRRVSKAIDDLKNFQKGMKK